MKNIIIYCRVSTKEQAENGLSLITQEKMCEEFASKNDLCIVKKFIEHGESAKTINRTKLKELLDFVSKNKNLVDTLVIYKIDRLSRQQLDYGSLKVLLARYNVRIHSLTENLEDSPAGRFFETMMAASAQMDNEIRGERARNGTMEALKQGRWVYAAPYGYIQTGGRGKANLIQNETEAQIIKKIFQYLSEGGHTIEDARIYSYKIGLKDNNNKMYGRSSFHRLVRRPIYKGFINIPNMDLYIRGSFPAIIEPKIFDLVQDILDGKNHNPPVYRKIHPDFPLRGTILCPHCNRKMTANWTRHKYPYYKCTFCKNVNLKRKEVHEAFEEYLTSVSLSEGLVELTKKAIELNWKEKEQAHQTDLKILQERQKQITNQESAISQQNIDGILPPRIAKEQLDKLEDEYAQIGFEIAQYSPIEEQNDELLEYSTYFLKNMCSVWPELDVVSQNELQKFLFSEGLQFDGEKFATPQESVLEEVKDYITIGNVSGSEPPGTRTQHLLLKRQLL